MDGQKRPECPGARVVLHNSMGTFHTTASVDGIVQCTAWMAVQGSPAGLTSEVFLLEGGAMKRTQYQELGNLGSSSSFIYDFLRALSKCLTSLSLIFLTCKMGTTIPIPLHLSHQVWHVSCGALWSFEQRAASIDDPSGVHSEPSLSS